MERKDGGGEAEDNSRAHPNRSASSKHARHRRQRAPEETSIDGDPDSTRQTSSTFGASPGQKKSYTSFEMTKPKPRRYLRKYEEEHIMFNAEERAFPSGAAWAHGSLILGSNLPDHGLASAKTKLLQRIEDEVTGEKTLITLTTPDTREIDGEELLFATQAGQRIDEEGRKRKGLIVPSKSAHPSADRKTRRRAFSEGDALSKEDRPKVSKGKRSESGQRLKNRIQ